MKVRFIQLSGLIAAPFMAVVLTFAAQADHNIKAYDEPDVDRGRALYDTTCVACHGADGKGIMPGIPNFKGKNSPLAKKDHSLLLHHIDKGFNGSGGMAMPPKGGNTSLSEQDIVDVLGYLEHEFSNAEN